jgi:hypothetical protein
MKTFCARLSAILLAFACGVGSARLAGSCGVRCRRVASAFFGSVKDRPVEFLYTAWVLVFDTDGEG